ncbi:MAG TPA: nuclear transport factor 2 family protein [Povalibacter sp.]|nr:nuclear transport factor 2 family protein [Povalibacter sp.]
MSTVCTTPSQAPLIRVLDAHSNFLLAARDLYAEDVVWTAPARNIRVSGRDEVVRRQLREAAGMRDPEFTFLRRNSNERQIIDEFAVRFVYSGDGIDRAPVAVGDFVELKRVRILEVRDGKVTHETCIENWTVLKPAI